MARYKVRISQRHSEIVTASNGNEAKAKVWKGLKKGYNYGYTTWGQFNRRTTAERI